MKMTVSVNNESGIPYVQYGTDRQKAKAARFANANNKELNGMAYAINNRNQRNSKFAKNIGKAVMSLPVVAGVAAAIVTKGKVSGKALSGLKAFGATAGAMGIASGVLVANEVAAAKNPKLKKAEKKHPLVSFAGLTAIATGAVVAADAGLKKISPKAAESLTKIAKRVKLDKLAAKMDKAPEAIKTFASSVAAKVSLPKGVKEKLSTLSSKIKMPKFLKEGYAKVANLEATKTAVSAMKTAGKAMLKNPVTTASALIGAALIGHAVKQTMELSSTKAKLKDKQLQVANQLVDAYAMENESLKTANAKAADAMDKGKTIMAEDAADKVDNTDEE